MRRTLKTLNAVLLVACALLATRARAEHGAASGSGSTLASLQGLSSGMSQPPPAARRVDLSRFSDGPRWVPAQRGRAFSRAQALGIGTHEATIKLLRSGASAEVRAAVTSERPTTLLWPVPGGHPGRGFGFTRRVRTDLRHNGIDIGAPKGTHVRAAESGLVVYSDNTLKGYGNAVIVLHGGGLMTLYAHNLRNTVQPGWFVERGERIALLGATGYAWGPHLHFELRDGFRPIDPKRMIRGFHSDEIAGPLAELEPTPVKAAPVKAAPVKASAIEVPEPEAVVANAAPANAPAKAAAVAPEAPNTQVVALADALAEAKRVLRGQAASVDLTTLGRTFRTLLFPLKGGEVTRGFSSPKHPALELQAALGAGVRAVADGVVLYSGSELEPSARVAPRAAKTEAVRSVVVLHADGTCAVYRASLDDAVVSGTPVQRGQWLGKLASASLRFEWRAEGKPRDPSTAWAVPSDSVLASAATR